MNAKYKIRYFFLLILYTVTFFINQSDLQRIDGGPYYRPLPARAPPPPPPQTGILSSLSNSFNSFVSNIFG